MAKTIKLNARELSDLQLIISTYEKKIALQSKGVKAPLLMYRPMENIESSFNQTYTSLDLSKELGTKLLGDNENSSSESISNILRKTYKNNKSANKEIDSNIEKSKSDKLAESAKLIQSGNNDKGLGALLNNCIPCDLRLESISLTPDISFLDQIISWSTNFVEEMKKLAFNLISPESIQVDICAYVNLLNFTCVPDFNALTLMLNKSISTTITSPQFKLPGLGDLISMIITPILAVFSNLAQAWINMVIKPIDCLIRSLDSTIRKFKLPPGINGAAININEKPESINLIISDEQVQKLNKKILDPTVAALEKLKNFIISLRNKTLNTFQKITKKYVSSINQSTRSIFSLSSVVQEVMKMTSMLNLLLTLKSIFETKLTFCSNKEDAIEKTYEDAIKRSADFFPGDSIVESPSDSDNVRVSRSVDLDDDEIESLGLNKIPKDKGVTSTLLNDSNQERSSGSNGNRITLSKNFFASDCSIISNREQFISVDKLLNNF